MQLHLMDDLSKSICLLVELSLEPKTDEIVRRTEDALRLALEVSGRIQANLNRVTEGFITELKKGEGH